MSRRLMAVAIIAFPLAVSAQSASPIASHLIWIQLDVSKPYSGTGAEQSNQMMHNGYSTTEPGNYPHTAGSRIGGGFEVGLTASDRLAFSVGHAFANLGGATGQMKNPRTPAGITYSFVTSQWELYSSWLMPSWRPTRLIRIGAGPGLYAIHERGSGTSVEKYGLHGEAALETAIAGPVYASLVYRFDGPGMGTTVDSKVMFKANLNYSSLTAGLGLSLFK